jgi:hypothetical protein
MRLKIGGSPVLTLGYDLLQISWIRTEFQKNVAVRNKFGPKEIGIAEMDFSSSFCPHKYASYLKDID